MRSLALILLAAAIACAPAATTAGTATMDPGSRTPPVAIAPDTAPPADSAAPSPPRTPFAPPDVAQARGWMPLAETGVPAFLKAHPEYDGRGVIIGILDSGIDAGVDGLRLTSTGQPKLLDLRDFSGEGRIDLSSVTANGDTVIIAGQRLGGAGRVAGVAGPGPWFAGVLIERPLGPLPASDVNGNGTDADTLPVVVAHAASGWVLFADTDGNGSLANESPVRDYLIARETFGWHTGKAQSPMTIAVNLTGSGSAAPTLDLFFDNSSHGTHVAGIAAGNDMYRRPGFDGVAPGAYLVGLKIANDALGGISTTGSMLNAIGYAIEFAHRRHLPLVLNMSFGVGNEREGAAVIDHLIDSVLAAHPDVIFTISAGNDGPGFSTLGFPGSARRAISIGATFPSAFLPASPSGAPLPDQVAFFSARGGELAKPDIVTPGVAYSTVPRWNVGDEQKAGTSMASPHAAGLAALLASGLAAQGKPIVASTIKRALMVTARPLRGDTYLDEGTGLPDISSAFAWLTAGHDAPDISVSVPPRAGISAAYDSAGLPPGDSLRIFQLHRAANSPAVTLRLRSSAAWLSAPSTITLTDTVTAVTLRYRRSLLTDPGAYVGVVTAWAADTLAGPAARLVNTVIVPVGKTDSSQSRSTVIAAGDLTRTFFQADSGRPFAVSVTAAEADQNASVYLHEPDGMPVPGLAGVAAGAGSAAALLQADARDVRTGVYQAVTMAPPGAPVNARIEVIQSPVRLQLRHATDGAHALLTNLTGDTVPAAFRVLLAGAQRTIAVASSGSAQQRIGFTIPAWAAAAEVDLAMQPQQWGEFTDFGVTLFDAAGRQIEQSPLNYSHGRMDTEFPAGHGDEPATLLLTPAFARPGFDGPWTAQVTIRLYADSAIALDAAQGSSPARAVLAPAGASGAAADIPFRMPQQLWPMGDGFVPLGVLVVQAGRLIWTREGPLSPDTPVPMK